MQTIGRLFMILAGMVVAVTAALLALPVLIIFDPLAGGTSLGAVLGGVLDALNGALDELPPNQAVALFAGFIWTVALLICVVPVVVIALIGEAAAVRSVIWYSGGTGLLAAAMPWLVRATYHLRTAKSATALELRFALLFFLTGTVAGSIYWLISGRRAGPRPRDNVRSHLA